MSAIKAIKVYKCVKDTCYNHAADNRYLGKFIKMDSRPRDPGAGAAGQSRAPIYVFEKETIEDHYPADEVIETPCIATGGRRTTRKACAARKRKTCRGYKGRRFDCPLKLSGKAVEITHKGIPQKGGWLSINNESLYISLNQGRINTAVPTKASCNDETQTIRIRSTKVHIPSCSAYETVKSYLSH
jgi:hypothetical protein